MDHYRLTHRPLMGGCYICIGLGGWAHALVKLQFLPHASKVVFALSVTILSFFVCASNISGTAERVCAKFTGKTCLDTRSDEFECQGQRSKVKVTGDKNRAVHSYRPRQRRNGTRSLQMTSRSSGRNHSVAAGGGDFGGLRAVYVW